MKQCTEAERELLDSVIANGKVAAESLERVRLERIPPEFFQECLSAYTAHQHARKLWDKRLCQMRDLGLFIGNRSSFYDSVEKALEKAYDEGMR